MRALWVVLLVPLLSGCTDGGGGFLGEVFGAAKTLDGPCGHVYNADWDEQIILQVRLTDNASRHLDVDDVLFTASHHDGQRMAPYDRERRPDRDGCLAFPLQGEGDYLFWGLGFREGSSSCWAQGRLGGGYDGSFDVAQGTVIVDEKGRC